MGQRHFSADDKSDAVLRLLRGEDGQTIAGELGITSERLARWESVFVSGGRGALKRRSARKLSPAIWQWAALIAVLLITIAALVSVNRGPEP